MQQCVWEVCAGSGRTVADVTSSTKRWRTLHHLLLRWKITFAHCLCVLTEVSGESIQKVEKSIAAAAIRHHVQLLCLCQILSITNNNARCQLSEAAQLPSLKLCTGRRCSTDWQETYLPDQVWTKNQVQLIDQQERNCDRCDVRSCSVSHFYIVISTSRIFLFCIILTKWTVYQHNYANSSTLGILFQAIW